MIREMAIPTRVGTARFQVALRGRASNSIAGFGRDMAGGVRETQLVPTTTLDALARELAPPDLVKIDVEGAEDLVLRGGRDLLENARPVVVCEVGPERRDSVTELFRGHRYALYDMDHEKATRRRLERTVWNTIAVPE